MDPLILSRKYQLFCLDSPALLICLYCTTYNTNTHAFGRNVLSLYFTLLVSLSGLSSLLPFVLTVQHTQHKHLRPRWDSNPQFQQASALVGAATLMGRIESAAFRLIAHWINQVRHRLPRSIYVVSIPDTHNVSVVTLLNWPCELLVGLM